MGVPLATDPDNGFGADLVRRLDGVLAPELPLEVCDVGCLGRPAVGQARTARFDLVSVELDVRSHERTGDDRRFGRQVHGRPDGRPAKQREQRGGSRSESARLVVGRW